jgi:cytochrome c-type biogenesis protein CcmE
MAVTPGGPVGDVQDDPESPDAAEIGGVRADDRRTLDVTPRTPPPTSTHRGRRGRATWAIAGLVLIVGGLGVVLFNGLRDASTFFYNVDEVVAKQSHLEGQRFRVQGNVVDGTVKKTKDGVTFVLRYHGKELPVVHRGDPPELFGPKIPVVLEGELDGGTFQSDTILIRHDSSYDDQNPTRVKDAEKDATTTTEPGPALGGASG